MSFVYVLYTCTVCTPDSYFPFHLYAQLCCLYSPLYAVILVHLYTLHCCVNMHVIFWAVLR